LDPEVLEEFENRYVVLPAVKVKFHLSFDAGSVD
jgi:hypothetical protein